jgi:Cytochrome c554 and c-prime
MTAPSLRSPRRNSSEHVRACIAFFIASACVSGCGEKPAPPVEFTRDQLLDPEACRGCHLDYYDEWSASMHAYASRDPVFLAMNRRGSEETGGLLGDFCVKCHAPMAVLDGQTKDGLNLETLPNSMQGVTCYFCHSVSSISGSHNDPLVHDVADPIALRAGITNPISNPHHAGYSALLSGSQPQSSTLCGSCHDIELTSPPGPKPTSGMPVELERTFAEWQTTVFAPGHNSSNPNGIGCIGCHMPAPARGATGSIFPGGPKTRALHDHLFPGVDVALNTAAPDAGADTTDAGDASADAGTGAASATNLTEAGTNETAVQGFLETTVRVARLCVEYQTDPSDRQRIRLLVDIDNVGAGHYWPSGAAQDRRAWADLRVLVDDQVVYTSGEPAPGTDVAANADADLWLLRDHASKTDGSDAHMFWDVAQITPGTIPGPLTFVVGAPGYDDTHAVRSFPLSIASWIAAPFDQTRLRVELRLRLQAIGYDVLDDLVDSGHLDPAVRNAVTDRTLLLNRALARPELIAVTPDLARFSDLSFEWSALTLSSPYFAAPSTRPMGTTEFLCAGMNRAP